jgi:chromosome segregation ATPase
MEENEDVSEENSGGKPMIGARIFAKTKHELGQEAGSLGLSFSEHVENILQTRHDWKIEITRLNTLIKTEESKVEEFKSELDRLKAKFLDASENNKQLVAKLQSQLEQLEGLAELLNDERLLNLFNAVKGKKDEVENADGKNFEIIYNSPKDLLYAMIYSFYTKN